MFFSIVFNHVPSISHDFSSFGYGSIPINTIFRGMTIHLPAILMFTRGTSMFHHFSIEFRMIPPCLFEQIRRMDQARKLRSGMVPWHTFFYHTWCRMLEDI